MENLVDAIRKITRQVECKELNQLRLEEELLIALAQNPNQNLSIKGGALQRVTEINRLQLALLGAVVNSKAPKLD